jgi:hypothetical protein
MTRLVSTWSMDSKKSRAVGGRLRQLNCSNSGNRSGLSRHEICTFSGSQNRVVRLENNDDSNRARQSTECADRARLNRRQGGSRHLSGSRLLGSMMPAAMSAESWDSRRLWLRAWVRRRWKARSVSMLAA